MKGTKLQDVLKARFKNHGGARVSHYKNTKAQKVVRMPAPAKVLLPMQQHIGAPCTPTVKVGDEVAIGQVVGDSEAFVSAPIHATVSGKVTAVGDIKISTGASVPGVTIESDGEMRLYDGIKPPEFDTKEKFLKAVRDSGLVGLGGAGFPAHVKLNFKDELNVDTLIINGAECEPFITVDYREMMDSPSDILYGIYQTKKAIGFKNVIIAVEDNKPDVFDVLKKADEELPESDHSVQFVMLKSEYPQGAEKVLIRSVTGKEVPVGKLPADVGVVVMNVTSIAFLGRYLKTGKPLVSRSLTVDGSAIAEPKNVRVPLGTPICDLIEFCGGFKAEPYKITMGGPMMGITVPEFCMPVIKNNNAILCFAKESLPIKKQTNCINCGKCVRTCPMKLIPCRISKAYTNKNVEDLQALWATNCMECGCCSYVCPAGIPLVQNIKLGKALLREEKLKEEAAK
ncbi:MAG: electron transport complex subunit RsxC [Clostridia bacterium]|nr:electron transport complex subunit RsxC [Clostridia bacterium]